MPAAWCGEEVAVSGTGSPLAYLGSRNASAPLLYSSWAKPEWDEQLQRPPEKEVRSRGLKTEFVTGNGNARFVQRGKKQTSISNMSLSAAKDSLCQLKTGQ